MAAPRSYLTLPGGIGRGKTWERARISLHATGRVFEAAKWMEGGTGREGGRDRERERERTKGERRGEIKRAILTLQIHKQRGSKKTETEGNNGMKVGGEEGRGEREGGWEWGNRQTEL